MKNVFRFVQSYQWKYYFDFLQHNNPSDVGDKMSRTRQGNNRYVMKNVQGFEEKHSIWQNV